MCHGVAWPRSAACWHMGEMTTRLASVRPRSCKGWNSRGRESDMNGRNQGAVVVAAGRVPSQVPLITATKPKRCHHVSTSPSSSAAKATPNTGTQ